MRKMVQKTACVNTMSAENSIKATIGLRLKEERERIGYTQKDLAARLLVSLRTQIKYEQGEGSPDAVYLHSIRLLGADSDYIVNGGRSALALSDDEQTLINAYQAADKTLRTAAVAVLTSGVLPTGSPKLTFEGNVGAAVAGDATFNAPVTAKKARKK